MKRGFTLIELLVVVLIIGILAAVALPQYEKAVRRSQWTEIIVINREIKQAEQLFKLSNGAYTTDFEELGMSVPAGWQIRAAAPSVIFNTAKKMSVDIFAGGLSTVYWAWGNTPNAVAYQQYWDSDRRHCIAYSSGGEAARSFCASLGGVTSSSAYPYIYQL